MGESFLRDVYICYRLCKPIQSLYLMFLPIKVMLSPSSHSSVLQLSNLTCTLRKRIKLMKFTIFTFWLFCLALTYAFTSSFAKKCGHGSIKKGGMRGITSLRAQSAVMAPHKVLKAAPILAKAASVAKTAAGGDVAAKVLGYLMGAGSFLLYSPIILKLLNTKHAEGFSELTWMFNLIGLSAAVIYPFKKGFPLSTYVEILILAIQSTGILGLVCSYKGLFDTYLAGMTVFFSVLVCMLKFPLSSEFLAAVQLVALLVCNYANIPQILLTFRTKQASWSPITAIMSIVGNIVRVFTTMQLTGDKLVLSGNLMGLVSNVTLLVQCILYKKEEEH